MSGPSHWSVKNLVPFARGERGFSLAVPVGVLALVLVGAFAAVTALGGAGRATTRADGSTRAAAAAAIGQIESCNATRHDYRECVSPDIVWGTDLPLGAGPGRMAVTAPNATSYTILATSAVPGARGVHASFSVYKDSAGMTRECAPRGSGECDVSGHW